MTKTKTTLTWLHISDIHFLSKTNWRDIAARKALCQFLTDQFVSKKLSKPDLIFCTGDIAYGEAKNATMAQQYGYAHEFFTDLSNACGGLPRERMFVVPGNHDVDRTKINSFAQETLQQWTSSPRTYEQRINQQFEELTREQKEFMNRLDSYGTFIEQHFKHQHDPNKRQVYTKCLDLDGIRVGIGGFNSAWSCAGPEDDRHIWLAAQWQFNHVRHGLDGTHVRIGLMHHPVDWLNEVEHDLSTHRIANDYHFWLHGHTHKAWVKSEANCTTVAAGAVNAQEPEEFGVNLVHLNFENQKGEIHLFQYSHRGNGWTIAPVPHQAPGGIWNIDLPETHALAVERPAPANTTTENTTSSSPAPSTPRKQKIYGRDVLIERLSQHAQSKNVMVIYGMRGNGKSEVIQVLLLRPVFEGKAQPLRITAHSDYRANDLFRQLAPLLGETAEHPRLPMGTKDEMVATLVQRYPNARPACIWIDKAHLWFDSQGWRDPELKNLFLVCTQAFGEKLHWFIELRERPVQPNLFGPKSHSEEIPGLDSNSLAQYLKEAAPSDREADWTYKGDELKRLYQWLGGGQGEQAHPLATHLLIEVALGKKLSPLETLRRLHGEAQQSIEEQLLDDMYNNVLTTAEQKLLQALSLYREPIPHDHADRLEKLLNLGGAWARLDQRCLLPSDINQQNYYLHGFIADWIQAQLPDHAAVKLHASVAECWLQDLNGTQRITQINIQRALEAFHHLLNAGQAERIAHISTNLFGSSQDWACERLWNYDKALHDRNAPLEAQRSVLSLITKIKPDDPKAWGFLGENWRKSQGSRSQKALECFRHAYHLRPSFNANINNLCNALISQGRDGALESLDLLKKAQKEYPESIDNYTISIHTNALTMTGRSPEASTLRQAQIDQDSRNPALYVAEAEYQASKGEDKKALELLDLAEQRGCGNEYTLSIRAEIWQAQGRGPEASALRQAHIKLGSRNPAFYNAEAEYQASQGDDEKALGLLDLAQRRGCGNEVTQATRAKLCKPPKKLEDTKTDLNQLNSEVKSTATECPTKTNSEHIAPASQAAARPANTVAPKLATPTGSTNIVLVTVNGHETHALLDAFIGVGVAPKQVTKSGVTYTELGIHGGYRLINTVCEMGTNGVGASQQRTREAIDHWQPKALIAIGIAFGVNEEKQSIGDVLVATQIQDYELGRLNENGTLTPRGDKPSSADALRNRLRQTDTTQSRKGNDWPKVQFGLILSGQKLVDNLDYRESLKTLFTEAVGGEMEGSGLYVSASAAKVDWIVIKAICDWGHNKNQATKDAWQRLAAKNAAQVLKAALQGEGLYAATSITNR